MGMFLSAKALLTAVVIIIVVATSMISSNMLWARFSIGNAATVEENAENLEDDGGEGARSRIIKPQPLSKLPFVQEWKRIYQERDKQRPRFLLVTSQDGSGFGNRLRSLRCAVMMCLLTERILVIDYPTLTEAFEPPIAWIPWTPDTVPGFNASTPRKVYDWFPDLYKEDLRTWASDELLVSDSGVCMNDLDISRNPAYLARLNHLFGITHEDFRRYDSSNEIFPFLLRRPSDWLGETLRHTAKQMNFFPGVLRTFAPPDYPTNLKHVTVRDRWIHALDPESMKNCLDVVIQEYRDLISPADELRIFITADSQSRKDLLAQYLGGKWGEVYENPTADDRETTHVQSLYRKGVSQYCHPGLVDWFILGECDAYFGTSDHLHLTHRWQEYILLSHCMQLLECGTKLGPIEQTL